MITSIPNRHSVAKTTFELLESEKENLKNLLRHESSYVCATADIWSGKKRSFMGVTVHWINSSYERRSAALACRRFANCHTGERIADLLQDIFGEFELNSNKVVATVTDNGSNFVKAFKQFGINKDVLGDEVNYEFPDDGENSDTDSSESENSTNDEPDAEPALAALSLRTTQFIRALPNHINGIKGKCPDLYRLLKSKTNSQLTDADFHYIQEYIEVSQPLAQLLDILQGDKNVYYGILIPSLITLQRKLEALSMKPWTYCRPIINAYMDSVETRFSSYLELSSNVAEVAVVAAFSHPAMKRRWIVKFDKNQQERLLQMFTLAVMKEIERLDDTRGSSTSSEPTTTSASYMDFFDFGGDEEECESATSIVAQQQIFNYFSNPSQEFEMLEAYPAIKKVFLKSNVILPSSAPVERLFSFASITNTPKANRLSDNNFEARVILKSNLSLKL
ncbi:hypothetical protein M8J75_009333 [Diaphorina citri]|nr:hypothetical protein M8J75_009333 [Diaphorina citri]